MILWVTWHSSIDESADERATAGSDSKFIGPEHALAISNTSTRSLIWDQDKNKQNKDWRDSIRFRQSSI